VNQSLACKEQQDREQAENRKLEHSPSDSLPARLAGEQPGEDGQRDGDRRRDDSDAQDGKHLGRLGGEAGNAGGRFLGALEHHHLEGSGVGQRGARQPVIERVAGLVRGERAEQRSAE
jgi:hypothetical protein